MEIKFARMYGRPLIEKFAKEHDFEIEDYGNYRVGEAFVILRHRDRDVIVSFILTGCSGTGINSYQCVYSDIKLTKLLQNELQPIS